MIVVKPSDNNDLNKGMDPLDSILDSDLMSEDSQPSSHWAPGTILLNEYRVSGLIGEGGMGVVYLVERLSDGDTLAMKTLPSYALGSALRRRLFFRELRTWMDLPAHPNIITCLYFRTIEDRLAIFSEYIDGGSLAEWIWRKKNRSLPDILDVSIQLARGLLAAHSRGILHLDVKPTNILLTREGVVKITDFGLSRTRITETRKKQGNDTGHSDGFTHAYCSPEQALNQQVDATTDIWSWALTVLHMFLGRVSWEHGTMAPYILENTLKSSPRDGYPAIPDDLAMLLRKCFQVNTQDRWSDFDQLLVQLEVIYESCCGKPYPRETPPLESVIEKNTGTVDNQELRTSPELWLKKAAIAADQEFPDREILTPVTGESDDALRLSFLEILMEARRIYRSVPTERRDSEVNSDEVQLLREMAALQCDLHDLPGALASCQSAVELLKFDGQNINGSLVILIETSRVQRKLGKVTDALNTLDNAWENFESISAGRDDDSEIKTKLLLQKLICLGQLRRFSESEAIYMKYVPDFEAAVKKNPEIGYAETVMKILETHAITMSLAGNTAGALSFMDQLVELRQRDADTQEDAPSEDRLAAVHMNRGLMRWRTNDHEGALTDLETALELHGNTRTGEENRDHFMAIILTNTGLIHHSAGNYAKAASVLGKSIRILEYLVKYRGRSDLNTVLASAYSNRSASLSILGEFESAVSANEKAVAIWEFAVYETGRNEFANSLASAYVNSGETFRLNGNHKAGLQYIKRAVEVREQLVFRDSRKDLVPALSSCYQTLSKIHTALENMTEAAENMDLKRRLLESF